MRDRPAANRVTKQTRNGSRGANAKAKSASSKRARKIKSELNDITISPDSSIASEVDDETSTLDQSKSSKSSKPPRGRPKASKGRNNINSSEAQANEQAAKHNAEDAEESDLEDQASNGGDIRRQLSELKQSYSKLETRYQELQELGVKKAEQNFEQLKAQAEENTRGEMAPDPQGWISRHCPLTCERQWPMS